MTAVIKRQSSVAGRVLALAMLPVLLNGCTDSRVAASAAVDHIRSVRVARVTDSVMAEPLTAAGTLGSHDEVALSFKVGGVIASLNVDEGDRVRAGQVLASLELREIDAGVTKARAGVDKAARDLARLERLAAESVATAVQVQDAHTTFTVAQADLETVAFNRSRSLIVAPAAGTVLRRHVRPGELVNPGAVVITLASDARGTVFRVGLPDKERVRIRMGDSALIRLDALPGQVLHGTVEEVGAAPVASTGAYMVEIGVSGAQGLPRGLVGRAEIKSRAATRLRIIPVEAVLEADQGQGTVFILANAEPRQAGQVERRRVSIAFVRGGVVGVSAGLDGVGVVVTDGAPYLDDRETVRVLP